MVRVAISSFLASRGIPKSVLKNVLLNSSVTATVANASPIALYRFDPSSTFASSLATAVASHALLWFHLTTQSAPDHAARKVFLHTTLTSVGCNLEACVVSNDVDNNANRQCVIPPTVWSAYRAANHISFPPFRLPRLDNRQPS